MCKKSLCRQVGLLVFGPSDLSAIDGRSVDSSSELTLISSGIFSCGSTTSRSTTTWCESTGFTREAFLETLRDRSPDVLAPGICSWSPDAFEGTSGVRDSVETATWFSHLHLKIFHLSSTMETLPYSTHRSSPFLHMKPSKIALLVDLPTASL